MKAILIIGAGFGQAPAIKKAKELGLTVICVDKNPDAEGMKLSDFAYPIDVVDFEGVLEIAKKHQIDGVMTLQSDLPVPTVGFINDHLGLRGVSLEVANLCSNKTETRKKLAVKNCAQPLFKIVNNLSEAKIASELIGYPCVIKAPDSSGSRGVVKVNKNSEIENGFAEALKYSRTGQVLVEEYIEGIEFGAQTFSIDGKCELVLMHNDTLSEPPFMIPIGHSFPFDRLNDEQKLKAEVDIKEAVIALGINDGPANIDLILDSKTNRVKIIEVGARIGATCLPELVKYYSGIDWVEASILSAIGEKLDLTLKAENAVAAMIISAPKDGLYKGYKLPNGQLEKVVEFEVTAKLDEMVFKLRKGTDRIGKVICVGESPNKAENLVLHFISNLKINVE